MNIEEAKKILEKNIRPIRDSLMVPVKDSYGCILGCDLKAKDVLAEEGITEEHIVINEGTRIGRTEAGILSTLGLFEVRIRRPARVAIISVEKLQAKEGFRLKRREPAGRIPAMLDYSMTGFRFEVSMNSLCKDDEKSLLKEIRKGASGSDLVITIGGISDEETDPVFDALSASGGKVLFRNAGHEDSVNGAYIFERKVILCLCKDPEKAVKDFDVFFGCCASVLMQCEMYDPCRNDAGVARDFQHL